MNEKQPIDAFESLVAWGWDDYRHAQWLATSAETALHPARVLARNRHLYECVTVDGHRSNVRVRGAFEYRAAVEADYPVVGDWVALDAEGFIAALLPRRTVVRRNAAGEVTSEQVIAANVDVLLIVSALDGGRNFTVGLIERALTQAWDSGAQPVIVLNKTDLTDAETIERAQLEAENNAPGVPVVSVSARTGTGMELLQPFLQRGTTVALLGKSGVGKSALINALGATKRAPEGQLRGDLQGRHTTTSSRIYPLAGPFVDGVLVVDVPGLRELQLWADDDDLDQAFPEIAEVAARCRFKDCSHQGEPGCAVQAALADQEITPERFDQYLRLQRELSALERRRDPRAQRNSKARWKQIHKELRASYRERNR